MMMIWIGSDIQHMRHDQISPIENVSVLACDMVTTTNAGTSTTPVGATMSHAKTGYENKGGCDLCNVCNLSMSCDMVTPTNAGTSTTPVGATMSHETDNDCIIWRAISTKIYGITPWRVTWSHLREPHKR